MNTLVINASIRTDNSITQQLTNQLLVKIQEKGGHIEHRDIYSLPFVTEKSFAAAGTPKQDRTPEQQQQASLSDSLIEELQAADTLIIGAPVYNFGPPAALKAWADLVARAGTTFRYTATGPEGLLKHKKAYIFSASGGTTMGSEIDFMSPWLKHFLGFIGIHDVTLIAVDAMSKDGEAKLAKAKDAIEHLQL